MPTETEQLTTPFVMTSREATNFTPWYVIHSDRDYFKHFLVPRITFIELYDHLSFMARFSDDSRIQKHGT